MPSDLAADWRRLLRVSHGPAFQLELENVRAWFRHRREAWRPLLLVVEERGVVRGIVPLMHLDFRRRGVLPYRRLRFLASTCTDHSTVLAAPGDVSMVVGAAIDWLYQGHLRWEELVLDDFADDHPVARALRRALDARGLSYTETAGRYYYFDLARPWPEVRREMSKRFVRKNVNLARNRITRAGEWTFLAAPAWDATRVVETAAPLHVARQAELGRASVYAEPGGRAFLHDVIEHYRGAGTFRSYWLRRDDRTIAYMLGFELDRIYYAWNMAFDPAEAYFYPSRLLLHEILHECHGRGLSELSLMRGESEYKPKWTKHFRANTRFRLRNRATVYGKALGVLESVFSRATVSSP